MVTLFLRRSASALSVEGGPLALALFAHLYIGEDAPNLGFGVYRTENETRNLPVKKSAQSENIKWSLIELEIMKRQALPPLSTTAK